jgi:methyl-accepting chemotaxis protein
VARGDFCLGGGDAGTVTRVTLISVGISVLGLAMLAALVWAISGAIAKPIGVLRDESLAIAGGDLTRGCRSRVR